MVGGGGGVMGRKRGVESLHLLGGHDEIINERMQNHQPPLQIKNERSLISVIYMTIITNRY